VGGHGPGRARLREPEAQAQKGDVGGLSVGVDAGGLDLSALDQPDVHTGTGQAVGVGR